MPKLITNPVYETALFKAVARYINKISPEILAFELAKASQHIGCKVDWDARDIDTAMTFRTSPQGIDFWMDIHGQYRTNKARRRPVTNIEHLI